MRQNLRISLISLLYFVATGAAGASQVAALAPLHFPVDCRVGLDCSIQNLFDHDPGPAFRDYACGSLGYDGHDGTDIRLSNLSAMQRGFAVLAAAAGTVRSVRDGMSDEKYRRGTSSSVTGREAGNAVVISHGDAWETQYSHLARNSVKVSPGEKVYPGQVLGLIGMSGKTEFPHLHFEVRFRGIPVDPFVGTGKPDSCGTGAKPLWTSAALQALAYRPTVLLQAGFATEPPDTGAVEAGELNQDRLPVDAPAIVFWVEVIGTRAGDHETMTLSGPNNQLVAERTQALKANKARWISYAGRKRGERPWTPGRYTATYRLTRRASGSDQPEIEITRNLEVR